MDKWSTALDLGSSLSWRGLKSHRHQYYGFRIFAIPQQSYNTFYSTNAPDRLQYLDSNTILYIHTTNPYFLFYTACPYPIYFISTSLKPCQKSCPHSTFHLDHRLFFEFLCFYIGYCTIIFQSIIILMIYCCIGDLLI